MLITVGFSRRIKWNPIGAFIRLIENEDFDHCYIYTPHNDMVFEADYAGVQRVPYNEWLKINRVMEEVSITIDVLRYADIMEFVHEHEGKGYGFHQIFLIVMLKLGIDIKYDNGTKLFICSELVARVLLDILGLDTDRLDKITPKQIKELLRQLRINLEIQRELFL